MDQPQATIEAAKIAAEATRSGALIAAIGSLTAVIGAAITAYVAYVNTWRQLEIARADRADAQAATKAALKGSVDAAITTVAERLSAYRGNFEKPVELSVLPLPAALIQYDRRDFNFLGPDVLELIALVDMRLNDYRRAKQPIQNILRPSDENRPVILIAKPEQFDRVIESTKDYLAALSSLRGRLR